MDDVNFEKLFSKDFIKNYINEIKKLKYESIDDLKNDDYINSKFNKEMMNTSLFVELFREKLNEMKKEESNKNRILKINNIMYLLEKIGNIKIEEPNLLNIIIDRTELY